MATTVIPPRGVAGRRVRALAEYDNQNNMAKIKITIEQEVPDELAASQKRQCEAYKELTPEQTAKNIMRIVHLLRQAEGHSVVLPLGIAGLAAASLAKKHTGDNIRFEVDGVIVSEFIGKTEEKSGDDNFAT